ncbi:MAG: alpha/beta fold hydrolase [Pseudomonadota bacterium]
MSAVKKERDGLHSANFFFTWKPTDRESHPQSPLGTVVVLHGYGTNKELMAPYAALFADAGFNVLLVDLPGHGQSGGDFVTFGVREAVAINHLPQQLDLSDIPSPLILFGTSLGGSTAIRSAATSDAWDAVIALHPFNDPLEVIPNFRRQVPAVLRVLLTEKRLNNALQLAEQRAAFQFDDARLTTQLAGYHVPTLIMHSEEDELIPAAQSRALVDAAPDAITLLLTEAGGGHVLFQASVLARCEQFMPWLAKQLRQPELPAACDRIEIPDGLPDVFLPTPTAEPIAVQSDETL